MKLSSSNPDSLRSQAQRAPLYVLATAVLLLVSWTPAHAISIFAAYWDTNDLGEAGGIGLGFTFGGKFALDIAGTYYEELTEDPLDLIGDGESPFVDNGFEVIPIDVGLRWTSGTGRGGGFYVGGGVTYYKIDTSAPGVSVDDESGWYAKVGFEFGAGRRGPSFFIEGLLRNVDATVGADLGFLEESTFTVDLEGIAIHAGVSF